MNILYLKYAVEVADSGSMNKAAEKLYVAQPNLSRAIKELERDLGITVFERNKKGMTLTPDGERLIAYGRDVIRQINEVEHAFREGRKARSVFSVSVPRASYVSHAFARFTASLPDGEPCDVRYEETNARRTITNVTANGYGLGVVRYASAYDRYYKDLFESKGLVCELVAEFKYVFLTSASGNLSVCKLTDDALLHGVEIALADRDVPAVAAPGLATVAQEGGERRVFVYERASIFDVLSVNPDSYAWVAPVPDETLSRYGLVERAGAENAPLYRDVVIYKKGYRLTDLDKSFITELCEAKRKFVSPTT